MYWKFPVRLRDAPCRNGTITKETHKMAEETIVHEKSDSIELSKNAKGEHSWKIKRYYDAESKDYKDIVDELAAIDSELKERFG